MDEQEWTDIGSDVQIKKCFLHGKFCGVEYQHKSPCGNLCQSFVATKAYGCGVMWDVVQEEPLTLSPSLLCSCGHHGFIREGKWVTA